MQVNKDADVAGSLGRGQSGSRAGRPVRWLVASIVVIAVGVAVLQRGDLTVTVTATGLVQPTNEVEISSELSGIIRTVKVDYNDRVKVGQVLAELDTDKLKAEVAHSRATLLAREANVQEAEARVTEKQSEYERIKRLQAKLLMRERRQISPGEDDDFNGLDMKEITSMLTGITGVLTGLLGAVAAVSLLVGGIGIMNIMLVSVTERTREIGIRLAIGAQKRQVLMQFLIEAVVLSLFGGLIGIVFGLGFAAVAGQFLRVSFVFDPTIVVVAFLFAAAVGVVFGYFPARRAARLDPIEALRHE